MPVFNTAANQILSEPVTKFYEGKALRNQIKGQELANQAAELEIGAFPAAQDRAERELQVREQKTVIDQQQMDLAIEEWRAEAGEKQMKEQAGLLIALAEEAEASDDPVAYANPRLPEILAKLPEGPTKQHLLEKGKDGYSEEELVGIRTLAFAAVDKYPPVEDDGKSVINLRSPDGKEVSVSTDDPALQDYLDQGFVRVGIVGRNLETDDPSVLGFGGGAGDKPSDRMAREVVTSAFQLTDTVDRISSQVDELGQSSLGAPGKTAKLVTNAINAVQGFKDLLASGTAFDAASGEEITESQLLDPKYYDSYFNDVGGAASSSSALQANAIGLAYSLARAANPDGRISDADLTNQLKRFNLGASDKGQIQSALFEIKHEILRNAVTHLKVNNYLKTESGAKLHDSLMDKLDAMEKKKRPADGGAVEEYDDGTKVEWID